MRTGKPKVLKGRSAPMGGDGSTAGRGRPVYDYELKRKAVRLRLEENIPVSLIAQELGIKAKAIFYWVQRYRERGEEALRSSTHGRHPQLAPAVKAQIIAVKRQHPSFGVKRIAQVLRRFFMMPGSAETVRQTLHKERLILPVRKKPHPNPSKPRFFERRTPNQLWQSDIFPFKLNGEYAYLIGYIDDHSRFITGLEVYRSQTCENVLEVYRRAVGDHGAPKEMLTDNGRQYVSWHGKTKFQMELLRGRVHHIRSAPHHPQTLGKIERFWRTIWEEFLGQAKFESLETARERIRWWVQYYNHKRPHQGIEGLCPADRFFNVRQEIRAELERGIAENIQELALHGRRKTPFFMVGRVGEKSVVIRAENDEVRMMVDKVEQSLGGEHEPRDGKSEESASGLSGAGESGSDFEHVGETAESTSDLQGIKNIVDGAERVGEAGHPRDVAGVGRRSAGDAERNIGAPAGKVDDGVDGDNRDQNHAAGNGEMKEACHADNGQQEIQCRGTVSSGLECLERGASTGGGLPGDGDQRGAVGAVAGKGDDGHAGGVGPTGRGDGIGSESSLAATAAATVGPESGGDDPVAPSGETVGEVIANSHA